ncbi:MAG: ATP-binding cassette domain-containing protein [Pirellulaceae bacterium]
MGTVLVAADKVGKSFASVRAVDQVSFQVHRQQIFSLLGPNGAGKTTLVRMLIGMLPPDQDAFALGKIAGRIFAAGIMLYEKEPNWLDVFRWALRG